MEKPGQKRARPRPSSAEYRNPRPQKRQYEKLRDARTIAVQSQSPALAAGSIDANAFTAARSFEITALNKAMRSTALAQRAFQDVPRSLRRRSASHNVKRVPRPLREKAAREMLADGTKAPKPVRGRKRLRMEKRRLQGKDKTTEEGEEMAADEQLEGGSIPKLKPRKVTKGKFAHRQEDKTWLPTHLYHAKRARIEPRWGFSIPLTPTEKSFRPTYRASHHAGLIAFDTSYYSTLFLHGPETALRKVLDMVIEPGSPASAKRYSSGKRSCETILYHRDAFPRGMIGPALILWRVDSGDAGVVQVMVRVHPAMVQEVWEEVHECVKVVGEGVKIEDARFEIGGIDLFGPMATEALFAILKVGKGGSSKVWNQLRGLSDPTSLPLGAVLDLDLCDPRIDFPPRKNKMSPSPQLTNLLQQWPTSIPGPINLFTSTNRITAKTYIEQHTRGHLQKARHDLLTNGLAPTLPPSPPCIPSLLLRRNHGPWTLLLPWSWLLEFWNSFMHYPQTRFGGITEYAQVEFEKHGMAYPVDWPGTKAGEQEGRRLKGRRSEEWERRPRGKKESWGRVIKGGEIGDPFSCDWKLLLNGKGIVTEANEEAGNKTSGIEAIRAQAKAAMDMATKDTAPTTDAIPYFLLSPSYAKRLLTRTSPMQVTTDLSQALLPIRLHFLQKGNVTNRARIYRLPTSPSARQKWSNLVKTPAKRPKSEYPPSPGVEELLGFVTTGNVSLLEGRGRAVGALAWGRVQEEEVRWIEETEFRRWCIVRDVGKDVGRLARWEVND